MPSTRKYSSVEGCCICGTNSSTEPFVKAEKISLSKKCLSEVFHDCFRLEEERNGEWCISCKEIAKKWLRTSKARRSSTNFGKVVDSKKKLKQRTTRRSSRSADMKDEEERIKDRNENHLSPETEVVTKQNLDTGNKVTKVKDIPVIEDALSEDENDDENVDEIDQEVDSLTDSGQIPQAGYDPLFGSHNFSRNEDFSYSNKSMVTVGTQTEFLYPALTSPQANANKLPFIDLSKWRQEEICCGTIFRGPNGEVLVDPKWLRASCTMCNRSTQPPTPIETCKSEEISAFDEKLTSLCS